MDVDGQADVLLLFGGRRANGAVHQGRVPEPAPRTNTYALGHYVNMYVGGVRAR